MRIGLENGNGYICDKCAKQVLSSDIVKITVQVPSLDEKKKSTGYMTNIAKADLCHDCYNILNKEFIEFRKPRK